MINNNEPESIEFTEDSEFPNFDEFISNFSDSNEKKHQNTESVRDSDNPLNNLDMNTIFKLKKMIDGINNNQNNPRSNLLLSLKPYLRPERRPKIDQYIKLFSIGNIMENFSSMDGENKL